MRNIYFLMITVVLLLCCEKKTVSEERRHTVLGFVEYTSAVKPNGKENLFLFEYQHCPSCDLLRNHLIKTQSFQDLTKKFNRYVVELGTPLGKKLAKKYDIPASSIFVLTKSDLTQISVSPFGLMSIEAVQEWLSTGVAALPQLELEITQNLSKKYNLAPEHSVKGVRGLLTLFDKDRSSAEALALTSDLEGELQLWSKKSFSARDANSNYYAIAQSYFKLAEKVHKIDKVVAKKLYQKSLIQFDRINSGDIDKDFGRVVLQFPPYIRLGEDRKVESEAKKLVRGRPGSRPTVFAGLAIDYFYYGENCPMVLKYGEMIQVKDLPVEGDQFVHAETLAKCYFKNKDLKSLRKMHASINRLISPQLKTWYAERFSKLKADLKSVEAQKI